MGDNNVWAFALFAAEGATRPTEFQRSGAVAIGELSTGAGLREISSQVRLQSPHTILHLPNQKSSRQRPSTVLAPLRVFIVLATVLKPSLADAMLMIPASITFGLLC